MLPWWNEKALLYRGNVRRPSPQEPRRNHAAAPTPSLCDKLVRTSLYVRVCTHGSVRACLYTRVCTYGSVLTNCTYGPVCASLYACAEQWLGRYTQLTAPSSQHAAPQLTAHSPQLTAASSQPPARNSQLIAPHSQLTADGSQLTAPAHSP